MQLTGAIAAKGVEDTAFYSYNPLISHNEVGDTPFVLGIPIDCFQEKMQERRRRYSLSLNCTATHDTKRGEDARMRINGISELTAEWIPLVRSWQAMNEPFRTAIDGKKAPSVNDEYLVYQSILGAFPGTRQNKPSFRRRTKEYVRKAIRESGVNSAHSYPDERYETACMAFIDRLLDPVGRFMRSFLPFFEKVGGFAEKYTLAMVALKTTLPGIPDFYQGSELWDLSYVDPDNRRPICFSRRQQLLADLKAAEAGGAGALRRWFRDTRMEGGIKLFTTHTLLHFRKRHPDLFIQGDYLPVPIGGVVRDVLAYARRWQDEWVLVIILLGLAARSKGPGHGRPGPNYGRPGPSLHLPPGWPSAWKHVFTGQILSSAEGLCLGTLMETFPIAVLETASESSPGDAHFL
jgi:(1->4)-alpha-D-glucan 1-alpha-D-glucosylmutase